MVEVRCPLCGGMMPYSEIAKQLPHARIHDKGLILKIVTESKEIMSGEILRKYNTVHKPPITTRHLHNLLRDLENEGKIMRRKEHRGRYGVTTVVTSVLKETT